MSPSKVEEGSTRQSFGNTGTEAIQTGLTKNLCRLPAKLENAFTILSTQYKSDTIHKKM